MKHRIPILLLLLLAGATQLAADSPSSRCQPGDTIEVCWERWMATKAERGKALLETKVARKSTALDSAGSPIASGAKSFLDVFSAAIENAELGENGQDLTLTWNTDLLGLGDGHNLQLQSVIRAPEVFEPLKKAIPEGERTERLDALKEDLGDFDDMDLSLSYTVLNQRFGRELEPHRSFYQKLFEETIDAVSTRAADIPMDRLTLKIQEAAEIEECLEPLMALDDLGQATCSSMQIDGCRFEQLGKLLHCAAIHQYGEAAAPSQTATVAALITDVEEVARAELEIELKVGEALGRGPISVFSDLLNNQPQLSFSALIQVRSETTGANAGSFKLTYEKGFFNLNSLRKTLPKSCRDETDKALLWQQCSQAFTDYVARVGTKMEHGNRLTISAEYKKTDPYAFELPAVIDAAGNQVLAPVSLSQDGYHELILSAALGRVLTVNDEGKQTSRIDFLASYEDVSNDEARQDRGLLSLTYSLHLNNQLSVPLGIVWANHHKYLTDVDKELSAHLGLRFRLDTGSKEE